MFHACMSANNFCFSLTACVSAFQSMSFLQRSSCWLVSACSQVCRSTASLQPRGDIRSVSDGRLSQLRWSPVSQWQRWSCIRRPLRSSSLPNPVRLQSLCSFVLTVIHPNLLNCVDAVYTPSLMDAPAVKRARWFLTWSWVSGFASDLCL